MKTLVTKLFVLLALLTGTAQAVQTVTFYHHDALGSVIAKSDEYGLYLNEEYQPYGEKIYGSEDPEGNEDWYTGKNYSEELDLTYFGARWYDAKQGRFLSVDPAPVSLVNIHSFNRYIYAINNPYKYVDPDGEEIRVHWHEVALGKFHTLFTIIPDNQSAYENDPRFSNVANDGRRYATLGAGPEGGKLVSNINRSADSEPHTGGNLVQLPSNVSNEDEYIRRLFQLDSNYGDDLDYDFYPANPSDQNWWWADDGYNSNSYTSGLLNASGGKAKNPNVDTPGYDKPVPTNEFQP